MNKKTTSSVITMCISERNWKSAPHKQDYKDAKKLLMDFGIEDVKVPKCTSIRELQEYTKSEINKQLA